MHERSRPLTPDGANMCNPVGAADLGTEERAEMLLNAAMAAWALADLTGDLSAYDQAVDDLAALRGGPAVARLQVVALLHRAAWGGPAPDEEAERDRRLLSGAAECLGAK